MSEETKRETRPSWGTASLKAVSGEQFFFGSDISQFTSLRLEIKQGWLERTYSEDRIYPGSSIVEVMFTPLQLSQLMFNVGKGEGVPCTIRYRADVGHIKHSQPESRREVYDKEIDEKCERAAANLDDLLEMIQGLSLSAKSKNALLDKVKDSRRALREELPLLNTTFHETLDRASTDAKMALEAYADTLARETGLTALAGVTPSNKLLTGRDDDIEPET
jgi:hypothetical protein